MSGIHSLGDPLYLKHGDLVIEHEYPDAFQNIAGAASKAVAVAPLLSGLGEFRYDENGNPSIFNAIRQRLHGLGRMGDANALTYSIPPRVQADMAARPMAQQFAQNYLDVAVQGTNDLSVQYDINMAKIAVAGDSDPLSEPVAQQVATAVFEGYGATHADGAALAQQTQDAKDTYQSVAAIPTAIGQAIGAGGKALTDVAGAGLTGFLSGLLSNPVVLVAGAGVIYYMFFHKKGHAT